MFGNFFRLFKRKQKILFFDLLSDCIPVVHCSGCNQNLGEKTRQESREIFVREEEEEEEEEEKGDKEEEKEKIIKFQKITSFLNLPKSRAVLVKLVTCW